MSSLIPGLHIDYPASGKPDPRSITVALGIFREDLNIDMENARNIIGSLPQTVGFEDIIHYLNEKRIKNALEPDTTLEQAVTAANLAARNLTANGYSAAVTMPESEGAEQAEVLILSKFISNGATGKHRVVLLRGQTGVGKSSIIRAAAVHAGLNEDDVGYWSMPTLAPENLGGIPCPDPEDPTNFYYRMLKGLNKYKVYVFDETNRAHPKVLNAVMQLLLERQINDMEFRQLQCIFLAINPGDEGNYSGTEEFDDAIAERIDHYIDIKPRYSAKIIGKIIGDMRVAETGVKWIADLPDSTREQLNPRRLEKILYAYVSGEDIYSTIDKKRLTVPLDRLEAMLKAQEVLTLEGLIADPAAVEARLIAGGQDASDLKYRYVELVKTMHRKGMREQFVHVAHLFKFINRDQIPRPDRDKGLWGFIEQSMKRHATKAESTQFFDVLKDRQAGRDSVASEIAQIGQYLREGAKDKDAAAAV